MKERNNKGQFIKTGKYINCLTCNKKIYLIPCLVGMKKFCSWKCKGKFFKGKHVAPETELKKGHKSWIKGLNRLNTPSIDRMAKSRMGKNNVMWKGGKVAGIRKLKNSFEWKEWRKSVFERDNYTCQLCNARSGNGKEVFLHPHHIVAKSKNVEKIFDVCNGITLCNKCHRKTYYKEKEFENTFNEIVEKKRVNSGKAQNG